MYVYIYVCMYEPMYICMYVCMMHLCVSVLCVNVCLSVCPYVCMYVYMYYTINVVPGFRSDSSLYCYRPVSYGQEMTTLIRQYARMTVNFNCWRYNTNSKV